MENQGQHMHMHDSNTCNPNNNGSEKSEPVRSRWTPKPEQILILESIFNSGMVNPPKDETVRIRKLLEKFGTVGDANVFYWFQNRRSRSRRRQRQLQAAASAASLEQRNHQQPPHHHHHHHQVLGAATAGASAIPFNQTHTDDDFLGVTTTATATATTTTTLFGSSPCGGGGGVFFGGGQDGMDGFFSISPQIGYPEIDYTSSAATSALYPPVPPNLNYHQGFGGPNNISGFISVFINGIATEVPRGPIDIKTVFGEDVMLFHSSGVPLPINEFGFLMQSLQHGESYFLVSKPTQVN